ncbi:polysaccharide biosynthesis protein [Desulfoluna limicola]|uniref:non-specific protein-tyrosine kinase n=1 Tax=Desulfoluna limicola TaxID=2810562 RepID=A0ABM7PII6_9BACT|nr:polysaccharide biosynthesis tyrosine autokinase [Desulfoluna limicola]BCS97106.1 polysaccharide biosynthesis protein [Desulfoluna limicola]
MGHFSKALEKMDSGNGTNHEGMYPADNTSLASYKSKGLSGPRNTILDKERLVALSDPWSYCSEQFRSIKTSILYPGHGRDIRTVLVTSAVPGEGKSFVTSNIAATIASSMDNSVLVIDSDMRRPTISDIFALPPEASGLDLYLNHDCSLEDVIYRTQIEKLSVIPAGNIVDNPSELITSSTMTHMLAEVRSRYSDRYVIIDSPPPLFAPETIAVSKHVDGIIIVIRNDRTLKKSVSDMLDKLDRSKVIGVVLNRYNPTFVKDPGYSSYYAKGKHARTLK